MIIFLGLNKCDGFATIHGTKEIRAPKQLKKTLKSK